MGCDIHMCCERYSPGKKEWQNIDFFEILDNDDERTLLRSDVYNGRDYNLFGALCGVRQNPPKRLSFYPRGVPDNISKVTCEEIQKDLADAHSHSWNTLAELREFHDSYMPHTGPVRGLIKHIDEHIKRRYWYSPGINDTDIRIVYWFDN